MGRFNVEFEVANNDDLARVRRGLLRDDQVRRKTISGVRYADGRSARRREAEGAYVELLGRHGTFNAVVEPHRKNALVGAVVLEVLDLLVDCKQQRLIPRDKRGPVYEIEEFSV